MGCCMSQPEFLINEELNELCEKIGNCYLKDDMLEAMTFSSLRIISDEVRRSFILPPSALKQFLFIRDFYRVSRKHAYSDAVQNQFDRVEQCIRMKTWGYPGEELVGSSQVPSPTKSAKVTTPECSPAKDSVCHHPNEEIPGLRHIHPQKTMVFTDELCSIRCDHTPVQAETHSMTYSHGDLEMGFGLVNANASTPLSARKRERGGSMDSHATTDISGSVANRLKSLYLCPTNCCSQETLGDFGFFDEEDLQL